MCFAAPVQSTAFPPATLSLLLQRKLGAWRLAQTTSFVFCLIFFSLLFSKDQTVGNHSAACDLSLVVFPLSSSALQTFSYTGCSVINYFTIVLFNREKNGFNTGEVISGAKLFALFMIMLQSNTCILGHNVNSC